MTCQCTCGKHILIEKSSVTFNAAAVAAVAYPVPVFHGNTAMFQGSVVDCRPNTGAADGGCSPAMPPHWHVAT